MKLSIAKLAFIFIGVYLLLHFMPAIPLSSVVTQKTDLFTVSGEGKVTVIPDTAVATLGINTTKPNVKSAQTEANTTINKITTSLKDLGIDSQDIKTSAYNIYPQYDYTNNANRITGYSVNVSLTVKIKDIDKLNQAIDSATAAGANTVSGIQLTVNDDRQKELVKQAREIAIKEAQDKASSLAAAAGMSLGRIVNIQETNTDQIRPVAFSTAKMANDAGGGETQIQTGSTDITSSITLSYETR